MENIRKNNSYNALDKTDEQINNILYQKLLETAAVEIATVSAVCFLKEIFEVQTQAGGEYTADLSFSIDAKRIREKGLG